MNLRARIEHRHLADAMSWTAKRADGFGLSPILAGVLIESVGDELRFSASGADVSAVATVPAIIDTPGRVLVSARLMDRIVKVAPTGTVVLNELPDGQLRMTAGGTFGLPTMPTEDYPQLPELPPVVGEIPEADWAAAVRQVAIAAGGKDSAPHWLACILIELGDNLTMVATNRHQLSTIDLPWQPTLDGAPGTRLLIPAATLADHAKALRGDGNLTLHHSEGAGVLGISSPGRHATIRLAVDEFAQNWRRIIPANPPINIAVPATDLDAALRRAEALGDQPEGNILIELEPGELHVVVDQPAVTGGTGRETLLIDYDGEPVEARVRIGYLRNAVAQVGNSQTAVLGITNYKTAVVVRRLRPDGTQATTSTQLVMPIRLDAPPVQVRRAA
ncbi:DNA polymerase III subunit beta [Kutzneria albida]|uniref:DNA polymerase III subunit beta n=1 Tax=Kutzneria albida DSM 43870 TaxID=1449976 RepID=W5WBT6_9PSEU|nr:DNA polymerase III subunit beta [Kutzneria albida]AHH98225.1 hypothetical protein KALB_4863 [Kutzneria albida DSM 43870]